jgi:hypothetical protein
MANCAQRFYDSLTALAVEAQEAEIDPSIVGKSVVREGQVFAVTAVKFTARRLSLMDANGIERTVSFDKFFDKRVEVVQPEHLLKPIEAEQVDRSFEGRLVFDNEGGQWKVLKVSAGPPKVVTLRSEGGEIRIYASAEIEAVGFKYREHARPTIAQRLAGRYAKERP